MSNLALAKGSSALFEREFFQDVLELKRLALKDECKYGETRLKIIQKYP